MAEIKVSHWVVVYMLFVSETLVRPWSGFPPVKLDWKEDSSEKQRSKKPQSGNVLTFSLDVSMSVYKLSDSRIKNLKNFRREYCEENSVTRLSTTYWRRTLSLERSRQSQVVVAMTGHQVLRVETVCFLQFPEARKSSWASLSLPKLQQHLRYWPTPNIANNKVL